MRIVYEDGTHHIKVGELKKYYKEKGLTIIGLNDYRGINLFKKDLLKSLSEKLKTEGCDPIVFNAFSSMFDKTEHINYLLESNISLKEMNDLQLMSALDMSDFPKILGRIGYISELVFNSRKNDKDLLLTDTLKEANEPIIIYSSGANDLMREVWNNPNKIEKDYSNREKNLNYDYTIYKLQNPNTIKQLIGKVENNISNILTLNNTADICVLGLYSPLVIQTEGTATLDYAIEKYNEYLVKLCNKYKMTYIGTHKITKNYMGIKNKFHISSIRNNDLADKILSELYNKKIWYKENNKTDINTEFKIQNHQTWDLLINLKHDLTKVNEDIDANFGIQKKVYEGMKKELEKQIDVVEKVLMKKI